MKRIILSTALAIALGGSFAYAKTYATVNGDAITDQEVMALLKSMPGVDFEKLPEEAKENVINQAIERNLLTKEAKREGIEKDKEYIEAVSKIKDDFALEIWMKKKYDAETVSDKEAKKYYDDNKDAFLQEETRRARHILVKTEDEAKAIIKDLKKSKNLAADFEKAAKEKSTGPSGKNGGDLGYFGSKQMVPEFSKAAFGLKQGEITKEPVKTQFGYHVIYLEDVKPQTTVKYADAKENIVKNLKMEKFRESMQARAKKLREKAKVEIK